jgi:hypothetical protein
MRTTLTILITLVWTIAVPFVVAQSFNSGSNGSDGALNLTTPGTIIFDPKSFNPPLDPAGDNIFNFTTINIGAGVTVKLTGQKLSGPVFWLAQGAVTIAGTLDLSGGNGSDTSTSSTNRFPATPGPGGFGGGVGAFGSLPDQPGFGPGGGAAGRMISCGAGVFGQGGVFTGNVFLIPLIGGSGGGGNSYGAGGGAGGGAILIASSTSISIIGSITAGGGHGGKQSGGAPGGSGSGGAIRLAAPSITGSGQLNAAGAAGTIGCNSISDAGGPGGVRIEAFQNSFTGSTSGQLSLATPFNSFVPTSPPSVRVVSVAGVPVSSSPTGSFAIPDVTINSAAPVSFAIQAQNIPIGTVVQLQIFSETGPDLTVAASPLAGTLAASTATASVALPSGFSRGIVRAIWTQ